MVTKKEYEEALIIVLAYHAQILQNDILIRTKEVKQTYKAKNLLVEGDLVECVEVHGNSKGNLTVGRKYPVLRVEPTNRRNFYFYIKNNQGKLREYSEKNTQFKALS